MRDAYGSKKGKFGTKRLLLTLTGAVCLTAGSLFYTAEAEEGIHPPEGYFPGCVNPGSNMNYTAAYQEPRDIFFEQESASLKPDATPVLDENIDIIKQNPEMFVIIEGHWSINEQGGEDLGFERALRVKDYMVDRGVDPGRLMTRVNCEISDNTIITDAELSDLNRRVHFVSVIMNPEEMDMTLSSHV